MNAIRCRLFLLKSSSDQQVYDDPDLNSFLELVRVKNIFATPCRDQDGWQVLVFYRALNRIESSSRGDLEDDDETPVEIPTPLSPDEQRVYDKLRKWRGRQAGSEGLAAYMIAHNSTLKQIVQLPAQSIEDLRQVKGLGNKKIEKYGADIIRIMKEEEGLEASPSTHSSPAAGSESVAE